MRSGAGKTQLPTSQYFKELQFITDTVTNRPTSSNVPSTPEIFTPPASPAMVTETIEKDNSATNPTSFTTTPTSFTTTPVHSTPANKNEKGTSHQMLMDC